ncbi:MAG: PKD domain-containing protein, partial [Candidatus Zixiibacteriota bacterium]
MARQIQYSSSKSILVILSIVGALMMCPVWALAQQGQDSAAFCPPPEADFGYPDTGCVPLEVQFKNLSTGPLYSWLWDFGDGSTSTVFDPKHIYTDTGFYTVSLTVTNSWGSDTETKQDYIMVITLPEADFEYTPQSGSAPLAVDFTDKSKGDTFRPIDSWFWKFGDGGTSAAQNPSHIYTAAGEYEVMLRVTNICGSDSIFDTVTVTPPPPEAEFGYPDTGCAPFYVGFTDLSTGQITSWAWSFGDGGTSTDQHPNHTYQDTGYYDVSLTVTGPGGSDTETKTNYIKVIDVPLADFIMDRDSGDAPLTVNFTDQSIGNDFRPIDSWFWKFGDGGTSTTQNPSHTYLAVGEYEVMLRVTNICGSDSMFDTVTVTAPPEPPVADFGYPDTGCAPFYTEFTDLSTGDITGWAWSFGDGGTSTNQSPNQTYQDTGLYSVSLTVTGPGGSDTE